MPSSSRKRTPTEESYPSAAHALSAKGPISDAVVRELLASKTGGTLFGRVDEQDLKKLAQAFGGWTDEQSALIIREYADALATSREVDVSALCRWVLSHSDDAAAVRDCMSVDPPDGVSITRVLSRAGSQKLVFLATWRLTQRQVVLKRVTGPPELQRAVMHRESQSHPLTMVHPNIIETHYLTNSAGEPFLVEDCLPVLLSDDWRPSGLHEAANLLVDIGSALRFLHDNLQLVHGDVKPDNIGRSGDNYILLDFGICRPASDFAGDVTATGSLRTRAPELFENDTYEYPTKVDVWALGATVFNSVVGRFPLFDKGETPPRISTPEDRQKFETLLRTRVQNEWDRRVDLDGVPAPLKGLISDTLTREPANRCSAADLCKKARNELSAYLRQESPEGGFSPVQELTQLDEYLIRGEALTLMPATEKQELCQALQHIRQTKGLQEGHIETIEALLAAVQ